MIFCCPSSRWTLWSSFAFVCKHYTVYLYLPLKAIRFSFALHNKGQRVEKADISFQTIAFRKVTRSKYYFDGSPNVIWIPYSGSAKTADGVGFAVYWFGPITSSRCQANIDTFNVSLTQMDFPFNKNTLVKNSRSCTFISDWCRRLNCDNASFCFLLWKNNLYVY